MTIQKPVCISALFGMLSIVFLFSLAHSANPITLRHVHGLSYGSDGKKIYIPAHDGLAIYSEGRWSKAPGPEHDYMGFSVTRDFIYSGGHPAGGSGLINPFGLIKSKDCGQTWEHLGLKGEADFHILATGYSTNVVYVFNRAPNSSMMTEGLYYTTDDAKTWRFAKKQGASKPFSLAVHPSQPNIVATGTKSGVFLSQDYGDTFRHLVGAMEVYSVFFELDEQHLWFGGFDGKASITRLDWKSGNEQSIALPPMDRDAVIYIAQNPVKFQEFAIATSQRDIYLSPDRGQTWKQIALKGTTLITTDIPIR